MTARPMLAFVLAAALGAAASRADAQDRVTLDIENGAAISGYNDVRIPGDTGTKFSLTSDLSSAGTYFWRIRGEVRVAPKHVIAALAAPLTIDASGTFDRPVSFMGTTFAAGVPVKGTYTFNSYRASYRYDFVRTDAWTFGLGVTGKIRDALIRLDGAGRRAEKTNRGFVPLVNFNLERRLGSSARLQIAGDALAAPQGRAEDVFAGVVVPLGRHAAFKGGYRFLEGGADNDEVYTFAAIHYAAAGITLRF